MSIYYNGAHSITFKKWNDLHTYFVSIKNTWRHLHMVPSSRPFVILPNPRIQFANLPRSNKILDLTNSLTTSETYEAREGDWEFIIDHDKWSDWTESFDALSDFFDGSMFKVVLDDQENCEYSGRVYISNYTPNSDYSIATIHYTLDAECEYETYTVLGSGAVSHQPGTVTVDGESYYKFTLTPDIGINSGTYRFSVKHWGGAWGSELYYLLKETYSDSGHTTVIDRTKYYIYTYNNTIDISGQKYEYSGICTLPEEESIYASVFAISKNTSAIQYCLESQHVDKIIY